MDLLLAESREDEGTRYGFMSGGVDGEDGALGISEDRSETVSLRLDVEVNLKLDEDKREIGEKENDG